MIELLIVVAIIGIILSIAVPRIKIYSFSQKSQSIKLCSDIRMIRLLKMTEGGYYKINLQRDSYYVMNGTKLIEKVNMTDGNEILYGQQKIEFSYTGAPSNGTTITICNKKTSKDYKITIVPASGRVLLIE